MSNWSWQDIQRAANDGSLDGAGLPGLVKCRQTLDGLANADPTIQKLREALRTRVGELIRLREQEELNNRSAEAERKRHDENLALDRESITVSREAIGVSKEANKISVEANLISKSANNLSKLAIWIAGFALACSLAQLVVNWNGKVGKPSPSTTPALSKPGQQEHKSSNPAVQPSNSTSTTSTNRTQVPKPATNSP